MREAGPAAVAVGLGLAAACFGPMLYFCAVFIVARDACAFHGAIEHVHAMQSARRR